MYSKVGLSAGCYLNTEYAINTMAFNWVEGEKLRKTLYPIKHPDIWEYRKTLEGLHWTAQEVNLEKDKTDWDRMTPTQKLFVSGQLAFFASADIIVLSNLVNNFSKEVDCIEAEMVYAAQMDQECIHAEAYALQIEALIDGPEKERLLSAITTMSPVIMMHNWVETWMNAGIPVGERLAAFAAIEGVMFSASFCALQWLREKNLLPGVTTFNSFIARDEGIHTLYACMLINKYLAERPHKNRIKKIFDSLIAVIDIFIDETIPEGLESMNAPLMKTYVRFQADAVLQDMNYPKLWRVENPFSFMDKLALNEVGKVNFFERIVTQYSGITTEGASKFSFDTSLPDDGLD